MAEISIVYWRDIPAQVIVRQGRRTAKRQLPERFEQAIDRCAMQVGARDSDAYLADWRRGKPMPVDGEPDILAETEAARITTEYDAERIRSLIAAGGWAAQQG